MTQEQLKHNLATAFLIWLKHPNIFWKYSNQINVTCQNISGVLSSQILEADETELHIREENILSSQILILG